MRSAPSSVGQDLGDTLGMEVCDPDLPGRSGNDLPGGQLSHVDEAPDDVTGDAKLLRGFERDGPNAAPVG